jgi:hypothetical protein
MRLRAEVRRVTGNTRHHVPGRGAGDLCPTIAWVEIEPGDGAYYLFYFTAAGECLTDTWHESLDAAKRQARFEFEIEDADWTDVA